MELNRAQREFLHADQVARKHVYSEHKKSPMRKIEKAAMFIGLPVAAGIAAGAEYGYRAIPKEEIAKDLRKLSNKLKSPVVAIGQDGQTVFSNNKMAKVAGSLNQKAEMLYSNTAKTSRKLGTTAKFLKGYGVGLLGLVAGAKIVDKLTNKVPPIRKFKEDHPTTTNIGALAGIIGALVMANPIVDKTSKLIGKIPIRRGKIGEANNNVAGRMGRKIVKLAKKVDTSKIGQAINKNVFKPVGNFLVRNPIGRKVNKWAIPTLIVGYFAKHIVDFDKMQRNRTKVRNIILAENRRASVSA